MKINLVKKNEDVDIKECPVLWENVDPENLPDDIQIDIFDYHMGKRSFAINDCDGYIFYNRESFTTGKPYVIIESTMDDDDVMEEISKLVIIINGAGLEVTTPAPEVLEEPVYDNYDDVPFALDDTVVESNVFENMKEPEVDIFKDIKDPDPKEIVINDVLPEPPIGADYSDISEKYRPVICYGGQIIYSV